MHHIGTQSIHTPRLTLRALSIDDAPAMFKTWANDARVTKYLRWEPHKNLLETMELLAAWELLYTNPSHYQWGICLNRTGQLIGSISVCEAEEQRPDRWHTPGLDFTCGVWEPGYCIGKKFWGQGYATEALTAVRDYWFSQVQGTWLACCHAVENPASGRVMQKAGWHFDHSATYHKFNGTPVECLAYCQKRPIE